ncbi:MAG: hypothetical protein H6564_11565 [Lewinellaceae bacterium]|nr:hypothetical protein [Lewinellaceae bacterium]
MRYVLAFINLLLYSNLWIACAAVAMAAQTQFLLTGKVQPTPLLAFIFFATLSLYAMHRVIGLEKVRPFQSHGRYLLISRFRQPIAWYAVIAAAGAAFFFFQLPFSLQVAAVLPSLISLAYVLPFFRGRRLRDLNYIKIFLIAIAWSWITVYLPALELGLSRNIPMMAMVLERALFVFALTLPFDIRDLEVDRFTGVRTLPSMLGARAVKWLAFATLLAMMALAGLNYHIDVYNTGQFLGLALSAAITFALTTVAGRMQHDYFYTGLLDGMMIVQFVLVWVLGK